MPNARIRHISALTGLALTFANAALAAEDGRRLYMIHCLACHGPTGVNDASGDIRGMGEATIRYAMGGVEQMPSFDFTEDELTALVAYIAALGRSD